MIHLQLDTECNLINSLRMKTEYRTERKKVLFLAFLLAIIFPVGLMRQCHSSGLFTPLSSAVMLGGHI